MESSSTRPPLTPTISLPPRQQLQTVAEEGGNNGGDAGNKCDGFERQLSEPDNGNSSIRSPRKRHPRLSSILRSVSSSNSCNSQEDNSSSNCAFGVSADSACSSNINSSSNMLRFAGDAKSSPAGSSVNFDTPGNLPSNPVLPLFTQLNVRFTEEDATGDGDQAWREASRWVRFQEDVEDGGKRWSKPFVPAVRLSALNDLRASIENGIVALDVDGRNVDEIIDDLRLQHEDDERRQVKVLSAEQFSELKLALSQRVKLRMKLNLLGRMSSVAEGGGGGGSGAGSAFSINLKSAPASRQLSRESLDNEGSETPRSLRHGSSPRPTSAAGGSVFNFSRPPPLGHIQQLSSAYNTTTTSVDAGNDDAGPVSRANSVSASAGREKSLKMRAHNQFIKKVPKGAECCNIQAGTFAFASSPVTVIARLKTATVLEDFSEIPVPTRFLCLVLGPQGEADRIMQIGRALGTLMSDQLFPLVAYRARTAAQLFSAFDSYTDDVTVLAPSAWDPDIRLDPPKNVPTIDSRLSASRARHFSSPIHTSSAEQDQQQNEGSQDGVLLADGGGGGGGKKGGDENGHPPSYDSLLVLSEDGDIASRLRRRKSQVGAREGEGLQFTGRLFGGLVLDIKRKAPWFVSDFKDALHMQTLASIIYIYLATITKAITFGGFLGDITDGLQGVLESFLGHALAGGAFCLLGGQPLTVLGCTGPVLIFEKILVEFCQAHDIDYMTFRLWIGLWSSAFCLVIVALDLSAIVRYFTRFTEEAFAALIGIIFIVESLKKLFKMRKEYRVRTGYDPDASTLPGEGCSCLPPENATDYEGVDWRNVTVSDCKSNGGTLVGQGCEFVPDIFLFSVILFFGTFAVASALKKFKFTPYFPAKVRSLLSDYAVILAILVFVAVDLCFDLKTPKLIVPTEFKPTHPSRTWVVPFFSPTFEVYMYWAASVPALLLTILLFMDQQITSVIVNRSEHKLKKGYGYHLDMLIVGVMIGVCSVIGLPWCVAATVLCLGHIDSLKMETETSAPGETPQFLGVREQRVTGVMVFVLTGLSVKLAPILKYIPMPVLYGVLMYMGIASLRGMQFVDRVGLLLMPPKYQPDTNYLRHVPLRKVHLFTFIQIMALALLWIIKSTPASLVFPLMVFALVVVRKLMDYMPFLFTQDDLRWLDNLMPERRRTTRKKKGKKKKEDEDEDSDLEPTPNKERLRPTFGEHLTVPGGAGSTVDPTEDDEDEEDEPIVVAVPTDLPAGKANGGIQ